MLDKTFIALGLAALLAVGCGTDDSGTARADDGDGVVEPDAATDAGGDAQSSDVGGESDVPAEPGSLEIAPGFVTFGGVQIDQIEEATITFSNVGGTPVFVGGAQIVEENRVGAPEFVPGADWPSGPLYIEPGTFEQVSVRYAPHDYGSDRGRLQFTTNDPAQPTVVVPLDTISYYRDIDAPRFLRFGGVEAGETARQAVIIRNRGLEALTIDAVEVSGLAPFRYRLLGGDVLPTVLDRDEDLGVEIIFEPTDVETQLGTLTITSDDPDEASFDIALSGNDPTPCLSAGPSSVDLVGAPGKAASQQVTLLNCGGSMPLEIASIQLDDPTNTFGLEGVPALPVTVQPRQTLALRVGGTLAEAGELAAELVVTPADPAASPLVVPVRLVVAP